MKNDTPKTDKTQGIVTIHGKDYMTVAARVNLFHEDHKDGVSIITELVPDEKSVVFKAQVTTKKGVFTGYSAVQRNTVKMIEKSNPYEVAETSAVGRALGFAGYGIIESIASADEMAKAGVKKNMLNDDSQWTRTKGYEEDYGDALPETEEEKPVVCSAHGDPIQMFRGVSKSKVDQEGNPKVYWWHKGPTGQMCFGSGYSQ